MSKKSSTEEKQNSAKLGINFPSGAKILLDSLAMLKNASQAEILVSGLPDTREDLIAEINHIKKCS